MSTVLAAKTALLALLQQFDNGVESFDDDNSAIDDSSPLNASWDHAAIIENVGDTIEGDDLEGASEGVTVEVHRIGIWVAWRRGTARSGFGEAKRQAQRLAEEVKDFIRPYEQLDYGYPVARVQIVRTSTPGYLAKAGGKEETATHAGVLVELRVRCES